jgi:hypothetical protein
MVDPAIMREDECSLHQRFGSLPVTETKMKKKQGRRIIQARPVRILLEHLHSNRHATGRAQVASYLWRQVVAVSDNKRRPALTLRCELLPRGIWRGAGWPSARARGAACIARVGVRGVDERAHIARPLRHFSQPNLSGADRITLSSHFSFDRITLSSHFSFVWVFHDVYLLIVV